MRIAQEEIFGPTTALIPVKSFDEALQVTNGIRYGLSSSIFTRDVNKAFRAMRDLQTGITYINAGTTGAEVHLPFGGTKDTGNGHREAGQAALDVFTEWKSLYVDYSGKLQRAQIDNVEQRGALRAPAGGRLLRPRGGAGRDARGDLRRRRRRDRRLRALLVVHEGHRHVPRPRGRRSRVGEVGEEEHVEEYRVEIVVPEESLARPSSAPRGASLRGGRLRPLPAAHAVRAKLWTDGGARGNPGPAAYAYVLEDEDGDGRGRARRGDRRRDEQRRRVQRLIAGLEKAVELGVGELEVVSDSELMVKQMRGEYRVKNEALRELSLRAGRLAREVGAVRYTAVRREHNKLADQLVNEALDAAG